MTFSGPAEACLWATLTHPHERSWASCSGSSGSVWRMGPHAVHFSLAFQVMNQEDHV